MHGFNSYAPVRAPSSPSRANACDHARMTRRGHACDIGCLPAGRRDRNGCRRDPAWHRDARGRALTSAWISGGPPLPRIEDPKRAGIPAPSWRLGSHPAAQSIGPSRSCSTARDIDRRIPEAGHHPPKALHPTIACDGRRNAQGALRGGALCRVGRLFWGDPARRPTVSAPLCGSVSRSTTTRLKSTASRCRTCAGRGRCIDARLGEQFCSPASINTLSRAAKVRPSPPDDPTYPFLTAKR